MKELLIGHIFLIICCVFYLLWWNAGFHPNITVNRLTGKVGLLFYITLFSGAVGLYSVLTGITQLPSEKNVINLGTVIITGIAAYTILVIISAFCFHRQITTELFLIVGWTILEIVSINRLFSFGSLARVQLVILLFLVLLSAILSFVLYMAYYRVDPMTGFIFGSIPLFAIAFNMLLLILNCILFRVFF